MYCPNEKMKVNAFKAVAIPRNCEYMRRFGRQVAVSSQFTGDERPPVQGNKVDMLYQADLMNLQDVNSESDES